MRYIPLTLSIILATSAAVQALPPPAIPEPPRIVYTPDRTGALGRGGYSASPDLYVYRRAGNTIGRYHTPGRYDLGSAYPEQRYVPYRGRMYVREPLFRGRYPLLRNRDPLLRDRDLLLREQYYRDRLELDRLRRDRDVLTERRYVPPRVPARIPERWPGYRYYRVPDVYVHPPATRPSR